MWSFTGLRAGTSAFYPIHYTTQHYYLQFWHIPPSLWKWYTNLHESLEKLQHCVMAVSAWMTGSKLKLNPSKTDFLLIGTKLQREKILNNSPCLIPGQDTKPSASAKNLGVVFDSSLDFRKDISQKKTYTVYPKHVGHAFIISVTCVKFENNCP